ncbi:MAG: anthranilate synthase component I [Lachnospiraceae bacterium]|nr:anthranilate synthase component I [Lachnospiraceae bacterium]
MVSKVSKLKGENKMRFEEFELYKGNYNIVPIEKEILSDIKTPIQVLKILKGLSHHVFMLESVEQQERWGRYTFLGFDPKMEVTCIDNQMRIRDNEKDETITVSHPKEELRKILNNYKSPTLNNLPSFTGGLVGYFSYDYAKYAERNLKLDAKDEEGFKDVDLMLFDKVIAFDNLKSKIIIMVNARVDVENLRDEYDKAINEIDVIVDAIKKGDEPVLIPGKLKSDYRALFSQDEFCEMVEKAKKYIYEGDIFQVVLSNRFEADYEGSLLNTYRLLRTINPSPYMFYISSDDIEVAGASPETLVKLEDKMLHTYPLAGTRKRGEDEEEDKELEISLLNDEKEKAEHNMLVDLGRNDIGKISKFGSVKVDKYMNIERYSHVMHIGSTVSGELDDTKYDALDAVDAILPAGTLSGAPKRRAMEIINELENNKRGLYGGAIGYIDFTGNLDTCIAIRLAFKKNGKVFVRSGAGIVADSVPINEYHETINKAKAVIEAISNGQEEL